MKKRKLIILLFTTFIITSNILLPVKTYAETIMDYETIVGESIDFNATDFTDKTQKALSICDEYIEKAKDNKSPKALEDAMDYFTNIRVSPTDIEVHKDYDKFDTEFLSIVNLIGKYNTEDRNELYVMFQKKLYTAWYDGNSFYSQYILYLKNQLNIPEIQSELNKVVSMMSALGNKYNQEGSDYTGNVDDYDDEGMLQDKVDDGFAYNAPEWIEDDGSYLEKYNNFDGSYQNTSYEKIGNSCYKITNIVDSSGNIISSNREPALKREYAFCGIFDNVNFGGTSNIYTNSKLNGLVSWNYLTSDQNITSPYTIQYSINNNDDMRYFYDTGIRTTLNKTISYEQMRDVLYQIAIKSNGSFVDDSDKCLGIISGKPIVIYREKDEYGIADFDEIFKECENISVKIDETRIGKSQDLEEKIINQEAKSIQIDDRPIELVTLPMIKNNRVLLPLTQIITELNATMENTGDKYIIKKDDITAVYELRKDYILVNDKVIKMNTIPESKDGYLMAEIQDLVVELGYELSWDSELGEIIITTK